MFGREAVQAGLLTAEHVPPRSFRGKELLLTCAPCNHTSGARLDAEARKRENPRDAMTGRAQKSVAVLLTAGGHTIPASLSTKGRTHTLKVPQAPLSPHYSRVTELLVVQAFSSVMTQMDAGVMTIEAMRRPVG